MNDALYQALIKMFSRLGNSPAARLTAIQGFVLDAMEHLTPAQIKGIKEGAITTLEIDSQEHSERGKTFGTKKAKVKAAKTYDYPGYCEELLSCQCATCKGDLSGRGFRYHSKDGHWYYYHPELKCFPKEHEAMMKNNPKWLRSLTAETN